MKLNICLKNGREYEEIKKLIFVVAKKELLNIMLNLKK